MKIKERGNGSRMNILNEDVMAAWNLSIDGIFIANTSGDILICNQAGAAMFGYTIEEITKLNFRDLVPFSDGYCLKEQYTREDMSPEKYIGRLNIKKDGTLIRTEINSKIITSNGQELLVAFVRDTNEPACPGSQDSGLRRASDYLSAKRMQEEQIQLTLHDSVGRDKYVLPLRAVEYIESNLKKLNYHLTNGIVLESYDTLNRIAQQIMPEGSFLRCHQSYIVNLLFSELDEHLCVFTMRDGARIPIRKKQYSQIKQKYYNYKILIP